MFFFKSNPDYSQLHHTAEEESHPHMTIVDESGRKKIKADFFLKSHFLEEDIGSELYFLSFSMTVQEPFRVFINPSIRLLLLIQFRVTRSKEHPEQIACLSQG